MTYKDIEKLVQHGKVAMLPNFKGYFKWDYANKCMYFLNGDYKCKAEDLPILDRTDWFYII